MTCGVCMCLLYIVLAMFACTRQLPLAVPLVLCVLMGFLVLGCPKMLYLYDVLRQFTTFAGVRGLP